MHVSTHGPRDPDARVALRDELRQRRREVDGPERHTAARQLAVRVAHLLGPRTPGRIGTYLPTDGEIDPTLAVDDLRAHGWTVMLPIVRPQTTMWFAPWDGRGPLRANRYGIEEPATPTELVDPVELDVVLVPCVGVDPAGNRLGFGAGYYDRAFRLEADPTCRTLLVGTVFDAQVVPALDRADWDVPLDVVICESATIPTGARLRGD
jgi:5-formyltetrahydrofolate cyclo-ligase